MGLLYILAIAVSLIVSGPAEAACAHPTAPWNGLIEMLGGVLTGQLKSIYRAEDRNNCYVGDHGSSFGPFQLHYPGVGSAFTKQTGLHARNPSTVPAQIAFMRRWGIKHHGFSSAIWHGLRAHHRVGHHHRHHWGHYARASN